MPALDIDRLAHDLGDCEPGPSEHTLPVYTPLDQDDRLLAADSYDIDHFLLSRFEYASLPDLRSDLRDFLAQLKEALVQLINADYEAFISLSTDLRGEGTRLQTLKAPLADLKAQVSLSRDGLQAIQDQIQAKLKTRAALREDKAFLHQLLKISDSVTRLETLLLIASPDDAAASPVIAPPSSPHIGREDGNDERGRANRAKHLARVAAEYNQLLYHVSKAQSDRSAFIDEIRWRIDRISSTLSSDLDHVFASTLTALIDSHVEGSKKPKVSDADKVRLTADLAECLKTYDALGLWRDAEDVLRREVMRDFVKKTIFPAALAAPLSPLVPPTPYLSTGAHRGAPTPHTATFPRTPYTPYSAFAKHNPFELSFGGASSAAHLLAETDDPLAGLYNAVLRFVDRDLRRVMDAAERVAVKSGRRPKLAVQTAKESECFEVMANVVWAEVGRAIMDELGNIVFSVGDADAFRKHYETTQAFVRALEFLAPSVHAVDAMRAHPTYKTFERRWQLPAYVHIRRRAIISQLEEKLTEPQSVRSATTNEGFVTPQASAIWIAIAACWSAEVFIPALSASFWRLTLQLLNRYKLWIENNLPALEPTFKFAAAVAGDKGPGSPGLTRSATLGGDSSAENPGVDKARLRDFAAGMTDIRAMETLVLKLWREEISMMLPDMSGDGEAADAAAVAMPEDALRQALRGLTGLVPPMAGQVVTVLSRQACEATAGVKSIPAQVRMAQQKRPPTEPSAFVGAVLGPVQAFFAPAGPGAALREEMMRAVAEEVVENASRRWLYHYGSWRKTEDSLRRLQRGQKASAFSLFRSAAAAGEGGARDDERIRAQMVLDVEAFGREAEALGVELRAVEGYRTLEETVRIVIGDGE